MQDSSQQQGELEGRAQQQVARVRAGDTAAFEAIFRAYYDELCGFAQSHISAPEVAEDLVQDLFLDLWRRREHWHLKGSLKAYLYGAVRNKVIKRIKRWQVRRRWKEREKATPPPRGPSPEEDFRSRKLQQIVEARITELPARRRQVYVLSRRHGLTYKEIAEVMDISPKTVENQMVRALKYLREHLKPLLSTVA